MIGSVGRGVLGLLRALLRPEGRQTPLLVHGHLVTDDTSRRGAQQGVMAGDVTRHATDDGPGQATGVSLACDKYR
jgi:hypothetical protein